MAEKLQIILMFFSKVHKKINFGSNMRMVTVFLILEFFFVTESYAAICKTKIPKKIWQTYKTKDLPKPAFECQQTWIKQNPGYAYSLWDDENIETYIRSSWGDEMYAFFLALPLGVMKADLWRYLIIKTEGGIYSDIDSICCIPIRDWISNTSFENDHILLIGLEHDLHFCQWTIVATSNHPAMEFVSSYILEHWKQKGIDLTNPHFVHATTGPGIWTNALQAYLGVDPGVPAKVTFERYLQDKRFRRRVNRLGVYLYPSTFYNGDASKNLYGSSFFGDGYKHWGQEKEEIYEQNKNF